MKNEVNQEIMNISQLYEEFGVAISCANDIVTKTYLTRLTEMKVLDFPAEFDIQGNTDKVKESVRLIRIDEMVYSHSENTADKLNSVFGVLTSVENTVFLLIQSDGKKTHFHIGVRCENEQKSAQTQLNALKNSLVGHFPGIKISEDDEFTHPKIVKLMKDVETSDVSSVSCVANFRDDGEKDNKAFLQGLEKFALSMHGKPYTAFILANSLTQDNIAEVRRMYELIYTDLFPFSQKQYTYSENENWNVSIANTVTMSNTKTNTHGWNTLKSKTKNSSKSKGTSTAQDNTASRVLKGLGAAVAVVGGVAATTIAVGTAGAGVPVAALVAGQSGIAASGLLAAAGDAVKKTATKSETEMTGEATTEARGEQGSSSDAESEAFANQNLQSLGGGTGASLTLSSQNKTIVALTERIDKQLERMNDFESYGMWECAAYFLSPEADVSEIAALTYKSIMSGEHTGVETSAVNTWKKNTEDNQKLHKYITNFMHPQFHNEWGDLNVTAGSFISGKELALHMGLPRNSVPGFPVVEHAEFAKEVIRYGNKHECDLSLGKIYNMGKPGNETVFASMKSMTKHTFITGTTGSGKSSHVFHLLEQFRDNGIKFLVIEAAKGEYKLKFGKCSDGDSKNVSVYGTNPKKTSLLRIDPFAFPSDEIHVLEHIDRLTDLLYTCWQLYAAMPALLKKAIIEAYKQCGWDVYSSTPQFEKIFPTFAHVLFQINKIVSETAFSTDGKGDYIGALCSRMESMTNGIFGMMFVSNAIPDKKLFDDENVIVDLSLVDASDTKALVIGMLLIKLKEYRMAHIKPSGDPELKHVTVLEEAHHLLRRTSAESTNLMGKSVEMLTTAIAEMRGYGEGFIIVDQSPGLLDLAVIRNTNTKIILNTPELTDRELVGKSANLTDDQITEVSKLETLVAVVYQNDWVEPVLSKIEYYKNQDSPNFEPEVGYIYTKSRKFSLRT